MKLDWKWFAIFVMALVIAAFCLRNCDRWDGVEHVTTVTYTDTLRVSDTVLFPVPYSVQYPIPIPASVDTEAVIADYFARKSYAIHYEDTAIKAVTDVTISENAVEAVKMDYEVLRKNTLTTRTVYREPKFALTLGGGLTYNIPDKKPGFEVTVGVNYRRSQFQASYDFVNQTPRLGWQYQIFRY